MLKIDGRAEAPKGARELLEELLRRSDIDSINQEVRVSTIDVSKGTTNLRGLENVSIREICPNGVKIRFQTGDNTTGRVAIVYTPAGMSPETLRERLILGVASAQNPQPTKPRRYLRELFRRYGFRELASSAIWEEVGAENRHELSVLFYIATETGIMNTVSTDKALKIRVFNRDSPVVRHWMAEGLHMEQQQPAKKISAAVVRTELAALEQLNADDMHAVAEIDLQISELEQQLTIRRQNRDNLQRQLEERKEQTTALEAQLIDAQRAVKDALKKAADEVGMTVEEFLTAAIEVPQ